MAIEKTIINGIGFPLYGHQVGRILKKMNANTFVMEKANGVTVEITKEEFEEIRDCIERAMLNYDELTVEEKQLWERWRREIPPHLKNRVSGIFLQFGMDVENSDRLFKELIEKYDPPLLPKEEEE